MPSYKTKSSEQTRIKEYYAGIIVQNDRFYAALKNKSEKKIIYESIEFGTKKSGLAIRKWLEKYAKKNKIKFIAVGLEKSELTRGLYSDLWLKLDIVPHEFKTAQGSPKKRCLALCENVLKEFDENNLSRIETDGMNSVKTSRLVELSEYAKFSDQQDFEALNFLAAKCRRDKLNIAFFNSTACGGGVALMRHAMIRLYRLLDVNVNWHVMEADEEIFQITKKKFHNILHGVARQEIKLTPQEKKQYNKWIEKNARKFEAIFKNSNVIVIDDPQPSGLIPYIKKANPRIKIIYRSHIEVRADLIDGNHIQQKETWNFIWKNIKQSDLFISHPINNFVPNDVPRGKLVYMPASTDPLDGLNKNLSRSAMDYYFNAFNEMLAENGQAPLDVKRPYIIQVARFDPSKGIPHVIESYKKLRDILKKNNWPADRMPQLVIAGNGAIDDPEGLSLFAETIQMLNIDTYKEIAHDIKVARLPHNDQLLNTLLRGSDIALQLSLREGFEVKVTEALAKGKPVIAYRTGGIPLQIKHGVTGFLVSPGKTAKVAEYAYRLLSDKGYYKKISEAAVSNLNKDYFTANNSAKWLYLSLCLCDGIAPMSCPNLKKIDSEAFKEKLLDIKFKTPVAY